MMTLLAIAQLTYRKSMLDRIFVVILLFGCAVVGAFFFGSAGGFEGYRASALAGSVFCDALAVYLGATLISNDLRDGSAYYYLTKPISRDEYLLGKFLGAVGLVTAAFLVYQAEAISLDFTFLQGNHMLKIFTLGGVNISISFAFLGLAMWAAVRRLKARPAFALPVILYALGFAFRLAPDHWELLRKIAFYYPGGWRVYDYSYHLSMSELVGLTTGYAYTLLFWVLSSTALRKREIW